jgi:WD40 repeat protein
MRLLCQFEGVQYVACGEFLAAINLKKPEEIRKYEFTAGQGSQIIAVTVSLDGKFVYGGFANKYIACWDTSNGTVRGSILHSKRPTAIVYTESLAPDNLSGNTELRSALVVSDKAGLIWGMDVPLFKRHVLLAGHTASVITDMTTDGTFIATADRDEKVRISNYPRMDTLQAFCMAHTNVVTSISFVKHEAQKLLVSCGWDHKLCLWQYQTGATYDIHHCDSSSSDVTKSSTSLAPTTATTDTDVGKTNGGVIETVQLGDTAIEDSLEAEKDADGVDDTTEKVYDEDSAGHYPVKIVAAPNSARVAVIFKDMPFLKTFDIIRNDGAVPTYSFGDEQVKMLSAVPCDICISSTNDLVVLLPKPYFIQIFSLPISGDTGIESSDYSRVISIFQSLCIEKGLDFKQQLVSTVEGEDAEKGNSNILQHSMNNFLDYSMPYKSAFNLYCNKGIRKHTLDKPFTKSTGIDPEKKKGSKRSRRRAGFEEREKNKKTEADEVVA